MHSTSHIRKPVCVCVCVVMVRIASSSQNPLGKHMDTQHRGGREGGCRDTRGSSWALSHANIQELQDTAQDMALSLGRGEAGPPESVPRIEVGGGSPAVGAGRPQDS